MSYNKRAAMRREKKETEKILSVLSEQDRVSARFFMAGKNEGMELASGIIFLALCEEFGFGQKRIERLMERISKESIKMDEEPTRFNVDYYIAKLNEKCGKKIFRR